MIRSIPMGWTFLFVFSLLVSVPAQALVYDSSVTNRQRHLLEADLEYFKQIPFETLPDDLQFNLATVLGLDPTVPLMSDRLLAWLDERLKVILGESWDPQKNLFYRSTPYPYVNPDVFPETATPSASVSSAALSVPVATVRVAMNWGGATYLKGKSLQQLWVIRFSDGSEVEVTSPRVGVIQLADGMFSGSAAGSGRVAQIFRLATLFHEARHSDGNGKSLTFDHVICPAGRGIPGDKSCDSSLNGAYTIDALLTEALSALCTDCTGIERITLSNQISDSRGRVLTEISQTWDPTPEGI